MSDQRPTMTVVTVFAVGLAALALAGLSGWLRCGRGSDCSSELALAIVAIGPASLVGLIVVLLMRIRADVWWLRTSLLALAVGVASTPLAAFIVRDLRLLPAFAALVAVLIFMVVAGESALPESPAEREEAAGPEPDEKPAQAGRPLPDVPLSAASPRLKRALLVLHQLAAMNSDVIRFCDALPHQARDRPATTAPERRS